MAGDPGPMGPPPGDGVIRNQWDQPVWLIWDLGDLHDMGGDPAMGPADMAGDPPGEWDQPIWVATQQWDLQPDMGGDPAMGPADGAPDPLFGGCRASWW